MKNLTRISYYVIFASLILHVNAQEFNPGPYGENYFDIAGPFILSDLNSSPPCDLNSDGTINIQDIILMVNAVLILEELDDSQIEAGDINEDGLINISDIVIAVTYVLGDFGPIYDFQNEWNGNESYLFIHYSAGIGNSSALWNSNTKEELLENSPMNVHYFFLSNGNNPEQNVMDMKEQFDAIIASLSDELQTHWNSYLHFVPDRSSSLTNWIGNVISDDYAIAIDRFQQIREIGYLGNPATFTGTHISYLANEAIYFNYEWQEFNPYVEDYDELIIFDREIYSGGWASTISQVVDYPSEEQLSNYSGMSIDLLRGCPDSNANYSDDACDDYDRIAHLFTCQGSCYETIVYPIPENLCLESGFIWTELDTCIEINYIDNLTNESCLEMSLDWEMNYNCYETARWITPFDRQPHHLTDISPFLSHIFPGGQKLIKYQESGWPNSLLSLKIRFYFEQEPPALSPKEFKPLWNGTVQFNPNYGENRPPISFHVPENAEKVEFVAYITGHGWGDNSCFNCSEFCNSKHNFMVNGGTMEFSRDFPEAGSNAHCRSLEMIGEGTIPNQYGTWGYGRAGWCPGLDVDPIVTDITEGVIIGDENIIDYDACRVSGTSCVTPPACGTCGYCPEIAMSSYIIIYY